MNRELVDIIQSYKDFRNYLNKINIEDFKKYSRQELIEFDKLLNKVEDFRLLGSEINEIIKNKKLEEYPQLLGVHHYPEINEIDFLSEEDKIKLDEYLVKFRKNDYIQPMSSGFYNLTKKWGNENINKTIKFLLNKNIIKTIYEIRLCHEYINLNELELNKYLRYFELKNNEQLNELEQDEYYNILEELEYLDTCLCFECDREIEITYDMFINVKNNFNKHNYKVIKDRDKSLDNV